MSNGDFKLEAVPFSRAQNRESSQPPVPHACNPTLGTREAEIWRTVVGGQPRQTVHQTPSPK
jgi:hypothetical protein